jgi:phosphoglycerate dehydrogenase-like enzyme
LAIVGYGAIGKEVAKRAHALGMHIYARDIAPIDDEGVIVFNDFEKVLPMADVISIHLPQTPETKNLFDDKIFGLVKNGAILINTSRAGVINEEALIKAVKEKNLKLDWMFHREPEDKRDPYRQNYKNWKMFTLLTT